MPQSEPECVQLTSHGAMQARLRAVGRAAHAHDGIAHDGIAGPYALASVGTVGSTREGAVETTFAKCVPSTPVAASTPRAEHELAGQAVQLPSAAL
jgi:hypothetical protein